jgi:hypothetical protein
LGVFEFGQTFPTALCNGENFFCSWGDISFDKGSLRFTRAFYRGYLDQGQLEALRKDNPDEYKSMFDKYHDPESPDDLAIEIGKCSPF